MVIKMEKMCSIVLLVMVLGWANFGNLSANVQHGGNFPVESMIERMERLNEMGKPYRIMQQKFAMRLYRQ